MSFRSDGPWYQHQADLWTKSADGHVLNGDNGVADLNYQLATEYRIAAELADIEPEWDR